MSSEEPTILAGEPGFEADVLLRDGSTVRVRRTRAEDEPRLLEFLRGLSDETLALRYHRRHVYRAAGRGIDVFEASVLPYNHR